MKRQLLILYVLVVISICSGCAFMQKWTDAQKWCATHPSCADDAKNYGQIANVVGSTVNPAIGVGGAALVTFLALGILGWRKKDGQA